MALDQEIRRIARLPNWSEADGRRVVSAWRSGGHAIGPAMFRAEVIDSRRRCQFSTEPWPSSACA
jgi:hypothetical protein